MKNVRVGNKQVPVSEGKTIAVFSGGPGVNDAGTYHFWTAVCLKGRNLESVFGRSKKNLDAGDRFRRIGMERTTAKTAADRKAYAVLWKKLENIVCIKPASQKEVRRWFDTHEEDAEYLRSLKIV